MAPAIDDRSTEMRRYWSPVVLVSKRPLFREPRQNVVFWAVMVKLFQVVPSSVYCKRTVLAAVFDQRCSHVNFTFR